MFYKKRETILMQAVLLFLILLSPSLGHAAGPYFNICFDRSLNINAPGNQTKISSIGDSVTLDKKGRLWLTGNETQNGYTEIICQNLSAEPVNVELTKDQSPWVNITSPEPCDTWQNNVLICPVGDMAKGVFCKISAKSTAATSAGSKSQQSATVSVRAVEVQENKKLNDRDYIQQRIDYYAAGIDLCSTIHDKTSNIVFSWIIYAGGIVDNVKVVSQTNPADEQVSKCIAEQISLWKFPEWDKDSKISYQF